MARQVALVSTAVERLAAYLLARVRRQEVGGVGLEGLAAEAVIVAGWLRAHELAADASKAGVAETLRAIRVVPFVNTFQVKNDVTLVAGPDLATTTDGLTTDRTIIGVVRQLLRECLREE
mgnify:FL=1